MRSEFLPFSPPSLGEEEISEVVATLRSGWITRGPRTARFEAAFSDVVRAPGALAVNSCTAALHLALAAHDVGPGDEVITSTMTFAATANVVEHLGARPVLVDVERDTLNLDPEALARAVTDRTRAVIPVHYAGHPAEMDAIDDVAERHGLLVVEDAAHALPAAYRGRTIGSGTNPVAFSFYATKNLTTGEGGMLTGEGDWLERARILSLHGLSRDAWNRYDRDGSWKYDIAEPGYKYNMTDVAAALGLRQLERLDAFQQRRREVVGAYTAALCAEAALDLPTVRDHVDPAWHLFVIRIVPEALTIDRDAFMRELKQRNIGVSVHFIPLHLHSFYRGRYGYRPEDFPVALAAYERAISLPLHPGLSDADVADVVEAVLDVVRGHRR